MRTLVAGSRVITNAALLDQAMTDLQACGVVPTEIIGGGARGVDTLAEDWARRHQLPMRIMAPDWTRYGKAAGLERNVRMVQMADVLVALHCGTAGTLHTITAAHQRGLAVYEYVVHAGTITTITRPPGISPQHNTP